MYNNSFKTKAFHQIANLSYMLQVKSLSTASFIDGKLPNITWLRESQQRTQLGTPIDQDARLQYIYDSAPGSVIHRLNGYI